MQKFKLKPTIYFGENSLSALSKLKAENVVIITDAFMESSGTARHIAERLTGCGTVHIFSEIRPDPPIELIVHSLRFLLDNKADAVIALGGGSSIDAAKSTVMMARRSTGKNILFVAVLRGAAELLFAGYIPFAVGFECDKTVDLRCGGRYKRLRAARGAACRVQSVSDGRLFKAAGYEGFYKR